ncbi:hypothetical protein [Ruegeria arenilitoris]|uniref:hypothetical protein n=1 Tax=Ruegeria arenilitoris TaxID=1173585 RepID=UPI00147C5B06|nr:hypothetical protein [Ruegeria arenilitoris]
MARKKLQHSALLKRLLPLVCGATMTAQMAIGEPLIYECAIQNQESRGWIEPQYVFRIDTDPLRADHATENYGFKPTRIRTDRKGHYRFYWQNKPKAKNGQEFWVDYFARIDPKTKAIRLRGVFVLRWIANPPEAFGECTLIAK